MMTFHIPKNKFHIPESLEINLAGVPECFFLGADSNTKESGCFLWYVGLVLI